MAYLEVINGPQAGQKVTINQETFFIGREPTNHLVLSDRTVSRKHGVINQVDGRFCISDLKSLKGLLINGSKKEEGVLEDGDEITFGAVRLHFYLTGKGKESSITGRLPFSKKKSVLVVAALLFLSVASGLFYYQKKGAFTSQIPVASNERLMEQHYEKGISLFNLQHDYAGAEKEWNAVLTLDPNKTTVYAQKAAKLLESLPNR